jgi:hypothetical protein
MALAIFTDLRSIQPSLVVNTINTRLPEVPIAGRRSDAAGVVHITRQVNGLGSATANEAAGGATEDQSMVMTSRLLVSTVAINAPFGTLTILQPELVRNGVFWADRQMVLPTLTHTSRPQFGSPGLGVQTQSAKELSAL